MASGCQPISSAGGISPISCSIPKTHISTTTSAIQMLPNTTTGKISIEYKTQKHKPKTKGTEENDMN